MNQPIALITGANSGIGLITAQALAAQGFELILLVRSEAKAAETLATIRRKKPDAVVSSFVTDLSDLASVRQVAAKVAQQYPVIDRLICNAGYGPDTVEFTPEGYEQSFVANHLGHFVLVNALWKQIEASDDGRVINVASAAAQLGRFSRFFVRHNPQLNAFQAYADGKLANILFAMALSKKLTKATAYSLHPGVVGTNFGTNYTGFFKVVASLMRPFMISPEKGAETTIYLATAPLTAIKRHNGQFFDKSKPKLLSNKDINQTNAEVLWQKSAEVVGG